MRISTTRNIVAAFALSAALPMASIAAPYIGVNYTRVELDGDLDHDFDTVAIRGGYEFTDWLAIEARYGVGTGDSKDREALGPFTFTQKFEVEQYYGVYGRLTLPNSTLFKPYVIAGYTEAELDWRLDMNGTRLDSDSIKDDAFSYGVGVNLEFNEHFAVNAEYMRLLDDGDVDVDGLTVGLSYRF